MPEVLVAGVAVADIVMKVSALPKRAEKYRADDAVMAVGGCAANAAVAVSRHGGHVRLAARLGDDIIGDCIVRSLTDEGVDLSLCDRRKRAQSSFSSILVDAEGERQIMNFRGRDLAETIDFSRVDRPDAVLADNRWPPLTVAALESARRFGVPGVVDAEAPFDREAAKGASHIVFSMQGLRDYAPGEPVEPALEKAASQFHAWVAVTDGPEGVWYCSEEEAGYVPAHKVNAVDTLAAGDIWHGVFTLALAEQRTEANAIALANAAAALKCKSFGGITTCPYREETEAFLKETDK